MVIYGPKQLSLAMTPFFFVLLQFFSFSFLGSSSASILLPAVGHDRHMYTPLATPCYSATVSSGSRECAVADSPGAVQHRREKKHYCHTLQMHGYISRTLTRLRPITTGKIKTISQGKKRRVHIIYSHTYFLPKKVLNLLFDAQYHVTAFM
jgi:hypothetical protein